MRCLLYHLWCSVHFNCWTLFPNITWQVWLSFWSSFPNVWMRFQCTFFSWTLILMSIWCRWQVTKFLSTLTHGNSFILFSWSKCILRLINLFISFQLDRSLARTKISILSKVDSIRRGTFFFRAFSLSLLNLYFENFDFLEEPADLYFIFFIWRVFNPLDFNLKWSVFALQVGYCFFQFFYPEIIITSWTFLVLVFPDPLFQYLNSVIALPMINISFHQLPYPLFQHHYFLLFLS